MGPKPAKVLVVEDEETTARFCRDLLVSEGYEVRIAPSAEEALKRVEEWKPDLLLLDIRLPGLNGLDLARTLAAKGNSHRIPIVLHTALTPETLDEERLRRETGIRTIVYKPCRPRILLETLERALEPRTA